jgi:acyl carrier protein
MKSVSAQEVRAILLACLESHLNGRGLTAENIPDDFDLLMEGVIDSLGIIELIAKIEEHLGIKVDFEELEPENLTIVGPFCRYIEEKTRTKSGQQ